MSIDAEIVEQEPMVPLASEDGHPARSLSKRKAHDLPGALHLAFSIFLLDHKGRVLLQRRSGGKRLWPYFWSNACCSHPLPGERAHTAVSRRVVQELGAEASALEYVTDFEYRAQYGSTGVEHERCQIWWGRVDSPALRACPEEVDAIAWLSVDQVTRSLAATPGAFTPWMTIEWPLVCDLLAAKGAL